MGAAVSLESTLTTVVLVGAVGVGYTISSSSDAAGSSATKPKKKKKKGPEDRSSIPSPSQSTPLVNSSSTIPGQFQDPPLAPSRPKKPKKKQTQKQTSELALAASAVKQSTTPANADESWTRVEARRRVGRGSEQTSIDVTTTDAGLTSSVTENSSPVDQEESTEKLTTLAERLVLKPPRTGVDDMLPPQQTLSRVMRIQPLPDEKPAPGFSWGDYEDVQVADGGGTDADGEDDGWGVVQGRRPRAPKREGPVAQQPAATVSQKQRQNAKKREAQKAAKAAAEAERVTTMAKHKRELERIRAMEQSRSNKKGKTSGGMTPVVDDLGKLVWE